MFSKQANIPPIVIGLMVWVIQMGVDAGQWVLSPILSWVLFGAVLFVVAWFTFLWAHNGLSSLGASKIVRWPTQSILAVLVPAALYFQVGLPSLQAADCSPIFKWLDEVKMDHNNDLDMPILIQFANLIPRTPQKYAMTVTADGGDLRIFHVVHKNSKNDPKPWQIIPSGIGYKAIDPSFGVAFVMTAKQPQNVQLDINYECVK